jgi:hypothetical protein
MESGLAEKAAGPDEMGRGSHCSVAHGGIKKPPTKTAGGR